MRLRSILYRVVWVTVSVWLILLTSLYLLIGSEGGSRWLLSAVDDRVDAVEWQSLSGSLVSGLDIRQLRLTGGGLAVQLETLHWRWHFWDLLGGRVSIDTLLLDGVVIDVPPSEVSEPEAPGSWPQLHSILPINLEQLRIRHLQIRQGESQQQIDAMDLAARLGPTGLRIDKLAIHLPQQQLELHGRIAASLPYAMDLKAQWRWQSGEGPALAGRGRLRGNLKALDIRHTLSAPYPLETEGRVYLDLDPQAMQLDADAIRVELHTSWRELAVPAFPAISTTGTLDLSGRWQDYRLALNGRMFKTAAVTAQPDSPALDATGDPAVWQAVLDSALAEPASLDIALRGRQLALALQQAELHSRDGTVALSGNVDANALLQGEQRVSWDFLAALRKIQLAAALPRWPAILDSQLHSAGRWSPEARDIAIELASLEGSLAEVRLQGTAGAQLENDGLHIRRLNLSVGENRLQLQGRVAQTFDLQWDLRAPALAQVYPALAGSVDSRGRASGTVAQPRVAASLTADKLRILDYRVGQAELNAQLADASMALTLQASGIDAASLQHAQLNLEGEGRLGQHQLRLRLDNGLQHLQLGLKGAWQHPRWQGEIAQLALDSSEAGVWQSQAPASLALGVGEYELADLCLGQRQASLCSSASWRQQMLTANVHIAGLAVEDFLKGLPAGSGVTGVLGGELTVAGPLAALQGKLVAATEALQLYYKATEDEPLVEFPARVQLRGDLGEQGLALNALAEVADFGRLTAVLQLDALAPTAALSGQLAGGFSQLQWLGAVFPELEKLDGQLSSSVQLGGSAALPELAGQLALSGLKMEVASAGLSLRDGRAMLRLDSDHAWQLEAAVTSDNRGLSLAGAGKLDGWQLAAGALRLQGDRVLLYDTEDIRLLVSPDLALELTPERLAIGGQLTVNDGHYTLTSLPTQAVDVSADERIQSQQGSGEGPGRRFSADIALLIDEKFAFEGFGLSTRLGGKLRLRQNNDLPTQAYGNLELVEGLYKSYGQNLSVDRGSLIFQGPLDNPGLNITAVRKVDEATVGVRIGGFAQDIRSELFSDPVMSPTDTLAILITGKVPGQMNQSDANRVMNAATALGISQSAGISNTLKETFGLDQLSLQAGETYTESTLVVGKYLNPKLFVSYVQNLFTPAGAIQLDYTVSKNLGFKAQSGKDRSIDLLYKLEHGD